MAKLFKNLNNNQGMTLVEVVVALALLGILVVPITIGFMNTIRIAKLIERQTEVNAVSEVVKDQVAEALIQQNYPLTLLESAPTGPEWYLRPFIADAKLTPNVEKKSPNLAVVYSSGAKNEKYFYTVSYKHESCYDPEKSKMAERWGGCFWKYSAPLQKAFYNPAGCPLHSRSIFIPL